MRSKKHFILGAIALAALGAIGVYHSFFRYSSTHHSSIRLSMSEGPVNLDKRIADFDRAVVLLDAWAPTAGFARVAPEAVGSMRQSWFSSGGKDKAKIVYFAEQSPKDRSFPMEIMMCFDPGGLDQAEIMTAEGYHRKPTAKLRTVHADIERILTENFPNRVTARIW